METTEAIHKWRCIRRFKQDEPVPEEALRKVTGSRQTGSFLRVVRRNKIRLLWHFHCR